MKKLIIWWDEHWEVSLLVLWGVALLSVIGGAIYFFPIPTIIIVTAVLLFCGIIALVESWRDIVRWAKKDLPY